jgi:hypothetical protein
MAGVRFWGFHLQKRTPIHHYPGRLSSNVFFMILVNVV